MNNDIKRVNAPVSGLVDDMLNQLDPDPVEIGENCHHCKKSIVTSDDYTSDDDNIYCSESAVLTAQKLASLEETQELPAIDETSF